MTDGAMQRPVEQPAERPRVGVILGSMAALLAPGLVGDASATLTSLLFALGGGGLYVCAPGWGQDTMRLSLSGQEVPTAGLIRVLAFAYLAMALLALPL